MAGPTRPSRQADRFALLWVLVPTGIAVLLMVEGNSLFRSVVVGNIYHLSATVVGFLFVGAWYAGSRSESLS